jgi:hypothetical protein
MAFPQALAQVPKSPFWKGMSKPLPNKEILVTCSLFFFWMGQEFKLALYHLSHTCSAFCSGYFGDGVLRTISPGLTSNLLLPISASQAAGITGVSYWRLASQF